MSKPSAEQLKAMRETPAELIDLKIPMLAEGMSRDLLCKGENSTFRIHCYSTGMGEAHGLHAHVEEEHAFIVLHGRAIFSDIGGKLPAIGPNKGIWLPKGCFYEFINPGPEPLVVLRFGACHAGAKLRGCLATSRISSCIAAGSIASFTRRAWASSRAHHGNHSAMSRRMCHSRSRWVPSHTGAASSAQRGANSARSLWAVMPWIKPLSTTP